MSPEEILATSPCTEVILNQAEMAFISGDTDVNPALHHDRIKKFGGLGRYLLAIRRFFRVRELHERSGRHNSGRCFPGRALKEPDEERALVLERLREQLLKSRDRFESKDGVDSSVSADGD